MWSMILLMSVIPYLRDGDRKSSATNSGQSAGSECFQNSKHTGLTALGIGCNWTHLPIPCT